MALEIITKINDFLKFNEGNYLEIGVYYGQTFFKIAKSNKQKKIYGIDPFISDGWTGEHKGTILSDAEETCLKKIKKFKNASLFKITSEQFLNEFKDAASMNISVVFIDGAHSFEAVVIDTDLSIKLIGNKPGLIIYDDLHIHGVREGIKDAIKRYPLLKETKGLNYMNLNGCYLIN